MLPVCVKALVMHNIKCLPAQIQSVYQLFHFQETINMHVNIMC